MLPQRRVSPPIRSGTIQRSPSRSLLSPKGVHGRPAGPSVPLKGFSKGPSRSLLSPKGVHGRPKPPGGVKAPLSLFQQKKAFTKPEMRQRVAKISPFLLKGKVFKQQERRKMIEQWFPHQKYGTHITEGKAKRVLRGLRRKEYWTRGKEKNMYKWQRKLLEAFTGIRKY